MYYKFKGKAITGVLSILPENEYYFEDEALKPNDIKSKRLKKIIGFGVRRRVKADTTLSDMFLAGFSKLLDEGKLVKDDIGAIVVVTLTQDYVLPQISSIIHGELNLANDVFCIDIPQACAGYVIALIESFMLLEHLGDKKVILCSGEIFNRKTSLNERKYEEPSFGGDLANISVIENRADRPNIYGSAFFDGGQRDALLIKYGGFKNPMTPGIIEKERANNSCSAIEMDGSAVFNFAQKEVPPAVVELTNRAGIKMDDIDYFLFHQPNRFMLEKLATALKVPYSKMPMDITERFGNSDSGTIPMVMTTQNNLCCLSGFGGGLTWASLIMEIGKMDFCENMISTL